METRQKRTAIVAGLVAVVAILFTIAVISSDTDPGKTVSSRVERVSPTPGGLQRPQADIVVDLQDGYIGRVVIDGLTIPDDQLEKVESLGQYTFRPGPGNVIEQFEAGEHQAEVFFWPSDEPEPTQPESYTWNFRVTS